MFVKNNIIITFQANILRVLQLNDFIKGGIYIIQAENIKVFIVLMGLKYTCNTFQLFNNDTIE